MQPLVVFQLMVLLTLANGTPVIAKTILGSRFAYPLDGGVMFFDGMPLFGKSKTIRGVLLSVVTTAACAPFIGLNLEIGALAASTAMSGDLLSSFLKRRINLPVSSRAIGLDQIPESLFPLLACRNALSLTALDIVASVVIFLVGEIFLSRLLYKYGLRDRPY